MKKILFILAFLPLFVSAQYKIQGDLNIVKSNDTTKIYSTGNRSVIYSSDKYIWLRDTVKLGTLVKVLNNRVGINDTTPNHTLDVNGGIEGDTVYTSILCPNDTTYGIDIHNHHNGSILTFSDGTSRFGSLNVYDGFWKGLDLSAGNYYRNYAWYRTTLKNPMCFYEDLDGGKFSFFFGGSGALNSTISWTTPVASIDSTGKFTANKLDVASTVVFRGLPKTTLGDTAIIFHNDTLWAGKISSGGSTIDTTQIIYVEGIGWLALKDTLPTQLDTAYAKKNSANTWTGTNTYTVFANGSDRILKIDGSGNMGAIDMEPIEDHFATHILPIGKLIPALYDSSSITIDSLYQKPYCRSWKDNDSIVVLTNGKAGWGVIQLGNDTAFARFTFDKYGVIRVGSDLLVKVVNTCTPTYLCIYKSYGGGNNSFTIRKRLLTATRRDFCLHIERKQ
jgi:hypothetical protein